MESKLERLSISQDTPNRKKPTPAKKPRDMVADSWDDEAASSSSEAENDDATASKKSPVPDAPPPTPASPTSTFPSWGSQDQVPFAIRARDRDRRDDRRPEKSTTAAGRLIAAGLGMRAPKKTEEQKAYDRAMRENELKRKNKERQAQDMEREENEMAQEAMWES